MQKIYFIPPIVFEILKFKNPVIWLAESIFEVNLKIRFSQACGFSRIIKVIMVHGLNPKILHFNGLIFLQNLKYPIFGVYLGIISKMKFLQKFPKI